MVNSVFRSSRKSALVGNSASGPSGRLPQGSILLSGPPESLPRRTILTFGPSGITLRRRATCKEAGMDLIRFLQPVVIAYATCRGVASCRDVQIYLFRGVIVENLYGRTRNVISEGRFLVSNEDIVIVVIIK